MKDSGTLNKTENTQMKLDTEKVDQNLLKKDLVLSNPKANTGPQIPILESLQVLFIVLIAAIGVKFLLPKFLNRFNAYLSPNTDSSIRIEESVNFFNGKLYVVSVRNKTLLLSANPTGVQCLTELDEDPLAGQEAFLDVLDESKGYDIPVQRVKSNHVSRETKEEEIQVSEDNMNENKSVPTKKREDIQAVLDRLKKLTGSQ